MAGENIKLPPLHVEVEAAVSTLLQHAEGGASDREGLQETPRRFREAWEFCTSGYDQNPAEILKCFGDGAVGYDEMVIVRDIPIYSLCEHHLAPFWGKAHIGYLPDRKIVGLSKFARLCDVFSRRLQVQERLTTQIARTIQDVLEPKGTGVVIECRHMCMESRGVRTPGTITTTSAMYGSFRQSPVRSEFLSLLQLRTVP